MSKRYTRKVKWEKWKDPIKKVVDEHEEKGYRDSYSDTMHFRQPNEFGPCIVGHMGIIPLHEENTPSKIYNLWMLHSNFPWRKKDLDDIKAVIGIESLDVFTGYRLRIGIGQIFHTEEVQQNVERALCANMAPPRTNTIEILKEMAKGSFKHWALQLDKRGKVSMFGGDTPKDVNSKMCQDGAIRRTYTSW